MLYVVYDTNFLIIFPICVLVIFRFFYEIHSIFVRSGNIRCRSLLYEAVFEVRNWKILFSKGFSSGMNENCVFLWMLKVLLVDNSISLLVQLRKIKRFRIYFLTLSVLDLAQRKSLKSYRFSWSQSTWEVVKFLRVETKYLISW